MAFIKSSINEKLLNDINGIFNTIFWLFIDKIKNIDDNNGEDKDEVYKMFDYLETFCNKLNKNNLSLFYLFTLKFTENYPYETTHKCFSYNEKKQLVKFIKKEDEEEKVHKCICPFMQVMIYILLQKETKQNSTSFFNLFLQTYKNKLITSLCYLNTFSEFFNNDNLGSLTMIGVQLINIDLSNLVYQEQNIPFLESCFEDIYSVSNIFLKSKKFGKLESILYRFYHLIKDLPSKDIIDKMNSNIRIINIIIDICCLINNANEFENKIKFKEYQFDGFENRLINSETYCLFTILILTHIINFDNQEVINSVFNILFNKIYEYKKYKESLPTKTFTPHLTIIKCYSLFLNRFCFDYSIKKECDLFDSFINFINIYPQAKELNKFAFTELINFFGFMISQLYSFFIYFGQKMSYYHQHYFDNKFIFMKCDITLMKYLMIQPEIKEQFNLQNILILSDIDLSNQFFLNLLNDNLEMQNLEINIRLEENNLKYINSLLEFLYLIIRDNLSMEKLAFRNLDMKFKMKDNIYKNLYLKEKNNIQNSMENEIIHFIIENENLVKRDECIKFLEKDFDNNYIELIDKFLQNNCEKIVSLNGLLKFSLKRENLILCDLDYIASFEKRKKAFEYMTNFHSKNYNLLNVHIIEPLNIKKKLMKNLYKTFYNDKNIDTLMKFYNLIYIKEKGKLLELIFQFNLTKILTFAFNLCSTKLLDEDFKTKLMGKINQLKNKEFLMKIKKNDVEKNKNKNLKANFIKKFGQKNKLLESIFNSQDSGDKEPNQNEKEICIYCRQPLEIDSNNMKNYYGKIHYYFSDSLNDLMKKQHDSKRKINRKFVTCNHIIHYKCFEENNNYQQNDEFECTLCKKLSNIILFDFSGIIKENKKNDKDILNFDDDNNDLIDGLDFSNEEIDFDNFYEANPGSEYQGLFFSNYETFEQYCSKLFGKKVKMSNFTNNENLLEETLKLISEDFEAFTLYYSMTNKKQEQINLWKNILYNLRFLFKYKILKIPDSILNSNYFINNITCIEKFEEKIMQSDFCDIVNSFIMLSFIFFKQNKENREVIQSIFLYKILVYYIFIAFIKNNNDDDIDQFFINNALEIKKAIDLFLLKYKIFLLLFNEEEKNINIVITLDQIKPFIINNTDFLYLKNSIKINNYLSHIKEQYLEIPVLKIIDLPEKGIDFINIMNRECMYCHDKNLSSFICLFCGKKICFSYKCIVITKNKKEREFSLVYHTLKCSGGNGLFLNISNAEIMYLSDRKVIESKIFIYSNDFGETIKEKFGNEKYKLNKVELEKGIKNFIDMTFRTKKATYIFFKKILYDEKFFKEINE